MNSPGARATGAFTLRSRSGLVLPARPPTSSPVRTSQIMTRFLVAVLALVCVLPLVSTAAETKVLPEDVVLVGAQGNQRLVLVSQEGGAAVADLTRLARFTSSNPAVATVDEEGIVRAAGDGEAVITASSMARSSRVRRATT